MILSFRIQTQDSFGNINEDPSINEIVIDIPIANNNFIEVISLVILSSIMSAGVVLSILVTRNIRRKRRKSKIEKKIRISEKYSNLFSLLLSPTDRQPA
jgi:hypothetical protein